LNFSAIAPCGETKLAHCARVTGSARTGAFEGAPNEVMAEDVARSLQYPTHPVILIPLNEEFVLETRANVIGHVAGPRFN
jgi:hypothetical protein